MDMLITELEAIKAQLAIWKAKHAKEIASCYITRWPVLSGPLGVRFHLSDEIQYIEDGFKEALEVAREDWEGIPETSHQQHERALIDARSAE